MGGSVRACPGEMAAAVWRTLFAGACLAVALAAPGAAPQAPQPRILRYAGQGDVLDLDPHGANEGQTASIRGAIYEGLLSISWDLSVHPALAVDWTQPSPTAWRFRLRRGVKFHDGTPFVADDVVYSFRRVNHASSDMKSYVATVKEVVKVDDLTVDVVTRGPDPILLRRLPFFFIISRVSPPARAGAPRAGRGWPWSSRTPRPRSTRAGAPPRS